MLEKLFNLKENNKLLYYILFPLVVIGIIIKVLADNNVIGASKDLQNTELETSKIQDEIDELNDKADGLVEEAKDLLDTEIEIDENWHNE